LSQADQTPLRHEAGFDYVPPASGQGLGMRFAMCSFMVVPAMRLTGGEG